MPPVASTSRALSRRTFSAALATAGVGLRSRKAPAQSDAMDSPLAPTLLAAGTRWQTEAYSIEGAADGPTVLVIAGVHGDEIAGPVCAQRLRRWTLSRGRLWVVPRASPPALAEARRLAPRTRYADLNRNFPHHEADPPRGTAATALWSFVQDSKPSWLIDLHEGFDIRANNPRSVGNSVLFLEDPETRARATELAAIANRNLPEEHGFALIASLASGSLARAANERLGVRSMILETSKRGGELGARADLHLAMVTYLLGRLGLGPQRPPDIEP